MVSPFLKYYRKIAEEYGGRRARLFAARYAIHLPFSHRWTRFIDAFYKKFDVPEVPPNIIRTKILRNYYSRALGPMKRYQRLIGHYHVFEALFDRETARSLLIMEPLPVGEAVGKSGTIYRFFVSQHEIYRAEGELTLFLECDGPHNPLASLTFSFGRKANGAIEVFLGGLQGARGEDSKQRVVEATKDLHGWRPKGAVLDIAYAIFAALDVQHIEAVALKNHPLYQSKRAFLADNDSFWREISTVLSSDGDFVLPQSLPRRSVEDVTPKKRGEWRKRYGVKEAVEQQVAQCICARRLLLGASHGGSVHPVSTIALEASRG